MMTSGEIAVIVDDLNVERHLELIVFSSQCFSIAVFILFSKVFKNCKKKNKKLSKDDPF